MNLHRRFALVFVLGIGVTSAVTIAAPESETPSLTGCTPKREAAFADLDQKAIQCLDAKASQLASDPLTAIAECGISTAASGIQDIIDLFNGMSLRYRCASALDGGPACSSVVVVDSGKTDASK